MPRFQAVEAASDGLAEAATVRLRFRLDQPCALNWQVLDPATGAILSEGERPQMPGSDVDFRIALPPEDGQYRLQVSPVEDRGRLVLIDGAHCRGAIESGDSTGHLGRRTALGACVSSCSQGVFISRAQPLDQS